MRKVRKARGGVDVDKVFDVLIRRVHYRFHHRMHNRIQSRRIQGGVRLKFQLKDGGHTEVVFYRDKDGRCSTSSSHRLLRLTSASHFPRAYERVYKI